MSKPSNLSAGVATRRLSALLACSMMLSVSSPLWAQSAKSVPTAAELIDALKSKPARGLAPVAAARASEQDKLIGQLKAKAQRGLSNGATSGSTVASGSTSGTGSVLNTTERTQLAEAVKDKPSVNIEVPFAFNSAEIGTDAVDPLASLGKALQEVQR